MKDQMVILDDKPIKRIGWWFEPDFNSVEVGQHGVTKIDCVEQFCGDYSIYWLQVWQDDALVARYNARNVDSVVYEDFWANG